MTDILSARSREPAGGASAPARRRRACLLAALSTCSADAPGSTARSAPSCTGRRRAGPDAFAGLRAGDETYLISVPATSPARSTSSRSGGCRRRTRRRRRCSTCTAPSATCTATTRRSKPCAPPASACWRSTTAAGATARRSFRRRRRIVADADAAWAELVRRQPEPRKRVIFGHSLGGAVAIDLASRKHRGIDYGALIVESTFPNLVDLAGFRGRAAGADRRLALRRTLRLVRQDRQDRRADPDAARRPRQHRAGGARPQAPRCGAGRRSMGRDPGGQPQQAARRRPGDLPAGARVG